MSDLLDRYARVCSALSDTGFTGKLLAVSKTFPREDIVAVHEAGHRAFGENYVQESVEKIDWFRENMPDCGIEWHFIGSLQANKTRPVAERFDWVETVNRARIAERLNAQRPENLPPLNVLIEVNIDAEESKSGVRPDQVDELARLIRALPRLRLRGLMAIPEPSDTHEGRMKPLMAMKRLFDDGVQKYGWDTLSMGMSADMAEAIACGSTEVRVGSAIFGARHYPKAS